MARYLDTKWLQLLTFFEPDNVIERISFPLPFLNSGCSPIPVTSRKFLIPRDSSAVRYFAMIEQALSVMEGQLDISSSIRDEPFSLQI